jgi:outer membrane protein TolC
MSLARWVLKGYFRRAGPLGWVLFSLATGCAGPGHPVPSTAVERILAPTTVSLQPGTAAEERATAGERVSSEANAGEGRPREDNPAAQTAQDVLPPLQKSIVPELSPRGNAGEAPAPGGPAAVLLAGDGVPCQPLTLPEAIALAFQLQPRLRSALESIEQAARRQDIVHAAFLPVATTAYHQGGFHLNVGGEGIPLGQAGQQLAQAFTFIPFTGALPVGLNIDTGYEVAELKVQWLICDFGRRLGRYKQAGLALDVAQLQADRARQTVANEVAVAYYQVLRARALGRTARESVRRAEDELEIARKLVKGGAEVREKVLRAQVQLAQARRALDLTEEAEGDAVAAFNLAVGLNVSAHTQIADEPTGVPPFEKSLAECLETAVSQRRELAVAQRAIASAQEGVHVARADFAPRLVAEGALFDFQQSAPRGHADLALGLIKLEWTLFEGGRRVAEKHLADSRVRDALAQAEEVADTIAFQVNRAYRAVVTARKGIDRSRPAVEDARESYRLVRARFRAGEATASDIVDAEATLTRAEQDYQSSHYDYRTALSRLEYAVGVTPTHAGPDIPNPIHVLVEPEAATKAAP